MSTKFHLFEVFGIELEYMVVQQKSLKVQPIVDELFKLKTGNITSDIENDTIAWSNELVAHVVEIKTNGPSKNLQTLAYDFYKNVLEINTLLKEKNCILLPTAVHPSMNPDTETVLWPHDYNEIYNLYNRIFNCKGHGWSNVQSMHINLPFYDDNEFEKLHAAIRILLPLIPALSASSPILDGKITGFADSRLEYYKTNQREIPMLTGKVIPEQIWSKKNYHKQIFEPIKKAITPYDKDDILDHYFLNSRGAIARFDRNAIEIRVIDLQECPKADIAIASFIIETLKYIIKNINLEEQKSFHENDLFEILNGVIKYGENYTISNTLYLQVFHISEAISAQHFWQVLFKKVKNKLTKTNQETMLHILTKGSLATRIVQSLNGDLSDVHILKTYEKLTNCLATNTLF
ncbi:glutamate-cysteine ligase family protein [Zhouia sp. PK063]|uniref:glutamate-cysteine ligase family protein n=1 Tax=Zhouia sp. PK063 TaxID=3373602 RepID=UPI003796B27E